MSSYSGATETTIYVGGLLEKFTNAVTTHWKHIVPTPSGEVQVIRRANGTSETLYVTTDPLGSTDAVLNAAGTVVMRASFAAYGERRASNWQGAPPAGEWQAIANTTRRGYTGHEALDNVMLVHMNGRVFDPRIGRFTSADPFIDGSASTQGWNRYGYVHGRVMSATDPSGFILQWGSNDIKPLDHSNSPNVTLPAGGENVIVTASRIPQAPSALARVAIQMNMMQAAGRIAGGNTGGNGGGGSHGDREDQQDTIEEIVVEAVREHKKCLADTYGETLDVAYALSIFQVADLIVSSATTEWTADALSAEANRNKYAGAGRRQGDVANRQLRTFSQFRRFNQAMAVAGSAGTGVVIGANIYCVLQGD